jgi:hypothetical protein
MITDSKSQKKYHCAARETGHRVAYAMRYVTRAMVGFFIVAFAGCEPPFEGCEPPMDLSDDSDHCPSAPDGGASVTDAGTADACSPAPDGGASQKP